MKKIWILLIGCLLCTSLTGQNINDFRKQREQEQKQFRQQEDNFKKQREEEYKQFKAAYEAEFERYKKNYLAYLNGEKSVLELMASDDNLKITPLPKDQRPKAVVSSVKDEKKALDNEIKFVTRSKPEDLLGDLSKSKDPLQQVKDGVEQLKKWNEEMEKDGSKLQVLTPATEPIKEEPKKEAPKAEPKKETPKPEPKKETVKKEEPKKETPKAEPKKDTVKKEEPKKETPKAEPKKETVKKEEPKKETPKAEPKKEETKKAEPKKETTNISIPEGKPTAYTRLSSKFGPRIHPITKKQSTHKGVDLAAPKMTPIYATADGTVTFSGTQGGYGNFIKINHQNGYKTAYAHMEKRVAKKNEKVKKGDLIGYVGSTGQSTGNHLHYEVYFEDKLIDPEKTM